MVTVSVCRCEDADFADETAIGKKNKQFSSQNNYSPDMNNVYICNHKVYYEK